MWRIGEKDAVYRMIPAMGEGAAVGAGVTPLVVRPARATYVVFGVLSALPIVVGIAPKAVGRPMLLEPLVIGLFVAFASLVWVRAFRIELTPREFRYRSLFGGARSFAYADIASARIQMGVRDRGDAFRPHYRLVVAPRTIGKRPIVVNLKVFPLEPLREVCAALGATADDDESSARA